MGVFKGVWCCNAIAKVLCMFFVHFRHNRHNHLFWVLLVCVRVLSETNGNSYIHIFQMAKVRKDHEIKMTIV